MELTLSHFILIDCHFYQGLLFFLLNGIVLLIMLPLSVGLSCFIVETVRTTLGNMEVSVRC